MNFLGHLKRVVRACLLPPAYDEQIFTSIVQQGDICFDVGANQGDVSLFLASRATKAGLVVAFEPLWPVYLELCRNIQPSLLARAPIITVPAGLADKEFSSTMQVPGDDFAMASMAPPERWGIAHRGAALQGYIARFISIDLFLTSSGVRPPDFMKIDVEGAELLVINGARNTFASGIRPLMFIEIYAPWEKAFGYLPWELLSRLQLYGYHFLFVCPGGLVPHTPTKEDPFPADYEMGYNVISFIPDRHHDRMQRLNHLRSDRNRRHLRMAPPPYPNRP